MKSKKPMFAFINSHGPVAVIQADSKKVARERAHLIGHIVKIPSGCKVRALMRGTICRAPIFFDGHFRAIEDALAEAGV
jgi:hypothetical protein